VTNIYTEIAQQQVKKHHTGKKTFFSINECKEEEEEGEKKRNFFKEKIGNEIIDWFVHLLLLWFANYHQLIWILLEINSIEN
jgi:hypothetical protein